MDDSTAVMAIVVILFIIPAQPRFWFFRPALGTNGYLSVLFWPNMIIFQQPIDWLIDLTLERGPEIPSPALLNWKFVQDRIPWGIFLLMGNIISINHTSNILPLLFRAY